MKSGVMSLFKGIVSLELGALDAIVSVPGLIIAAGWPSRYHLPISSLLRSGIIWIGSSFPECPVLAWARLVPGIAKIWSLIVTFIISMVFLTSCPEGVVQKGNDAW